MGRRGEAGGGGGGGGGGKMKGGGRKEEEDGGRKRMTKLLDQCMHISNMVWVSSDVCHNYDMMVCHKTSWCGCQVMCAMS